MRATGDKHGSRRDRIQHVAARALRLSVVTLVALAAFGILAGRNVYGGIDRAAMHFGDELLRLHESTSSGDARGSAYRMRINGQSIMIASALSRHGASFVLDAFEQECREHADAMPEQFGRLEETVNGEGVPAGEGFKGLGTMRNERGGRGFVACFAPGRAVDSADELHRIGEAAKSGDVGRLGDVRYVVAENVDGGSHVIAAWTRGAFDVTKMFPKEGDAPGEDIPGAPRPDGSRRILAAGAEGTSYGVTLYEATGTTDALYGAVDWNLAKAGWAKTPAPMDKTSHAFSKAGVDLVVTASETRRGLVGVSYVYSRMR